MRIACFYPSSIYSAWSASHGIPAALKRMGHDAANKLRSHMDSCDLVIASGAEHLPALLEWSRNSIPKIAWYHESSRREDQSFEPQIRSLLNVFDYHFFPSYQDVDRFSSLAPGRCFWLPFGVDTELFRPPPITHANPADIDIGFIGLIYPKRQQFLNKLSSHLKDVQIICGNSAVQDIDGVNIEESAWRLAHNYRRLKVLFNLPSLSQHLVTKCTEAMSCGTCVLTPALTGAAEKNMEPFVHGRHLFYYPETHLGLIAQTLRSLIEDDATRQKVALEGMNEVRTKHRLEDRLQVILDVVAGRKETVCTGSAG